MRNRGFSAATIAVVGSFATGYNVLGTSLLVVSVIGGIVLLAYDAFRERCFW